MGGITNKTVHLSFAVDWSKEVNPLLGSPDATINFYEKIGQVLNFTPAQIFAKTDREHRQQINKIKKLLQAAPVDVLRELETQIKAKLKIK